MSISAGELRELVVEHLADLGIDMDVQGRLNLQQDDKDFIRRLHRPAVRLEMEKSAQWISHAYRKYRQFFANGQEVDVLNLRPLLIRVEKSWQNDLWRLARYTWTLPYSQGFGRRMRYLILDGHNNKLIGILALQSPPLTFPARDRLFTYRPGAHKTAVINQTMDIHTLGAVMPYSRLLGGKLVALAASSNEIRRDYHEKYSNRVTEMEGRRLPANLVALTTTSAFGRSSIYNRLEVEGKPIAVSLGLTEGYGHFHLEPLYPKFKEFLETEGVSVEQGFGTGPRRKWQLMKTALRRIGFDGEVLRHGVRREAFLFPLIHNLAAYMNGEMARAQPRSLPFEKLAIYWRERWLLPRAERVDGWHKWDKVVYDDYLTIHRERNVRNA